MIIGISIGVIVVIFLAIIWRIYNKLVQADNQVDESLSLIDVHLKKRYELIPNLVEIVKGYNQHEANLLTDLVAKRSESFKEVATKAQVDGSVTQQLRNFRMQVENYPDLKANIQFLKLMDSLTLVEDELAMARRYYNGTVRDLHNKMEVFPNVIFAARFGLKKKAFYEITSGEAQRPEIDLTEKT